MHDHAVHNAGDHLLQWGQESTSASDAVALYLTPERAVWWPEQQTLFVADLHVGKAAVFRSHGLPVPQGTTTGTLNRLSAVLKRTHAKKLIVLGDFLHAKESQAAATLAALRRWRTAHADVSCVIVQGNHDRHAGEPAPELRFETHVGPLQLGPIWGAHDTDEVSHAPLHKLALVGHEHPVMHLRDRFDHLRLPCYILRRNVLTLPAFGDFTGGFAVSRHEGKVFIVSDKVVPLPTQIQGPPPEGK